MYPAIFVSIGLILYLFIHNWIKKDGIGRIVLLVFIGGFLAYYACRFGIQVGLYICHCMSAATANDLTKHTQIFLLAPLVFVIIIEHIYAERYKKDKK
jgi:NADH:ubiquinone oxidoreductase subunit 2 (subunit N)